MLCSNINIIERIHKVEWIDNFMIYDLTICFFGNQETRQQDVGLIFYINVSLRAVTLSGVEGREVSKSLYFKGLDSARPDIFFEPRYKIDLRF